MLSAYKSVRTLHEALYVKCAELKKEVVGTTDLCQVADTVYLLRKSTELLKDSAKELEKLSKIISTGAALVAISNGSCHVPDGKYARAHLKSSFSATLPSIHKDNARYKRVCEVLGVRYDGLVRLHYPAVKEYMTAVLEKGGTLPEEIEKLKQHNEVKVVATAIGEVDSDLAKIHPLV